MANDVYQLVMRGNSRGQFWETIQHYQAGVASAANPVAAATNLIDGFRGDVEDKITAMMSEECEITGYTAKRVNNGGSPSVLEPISAVPGDIASDPLPAANGYLINGAYTHSGKFRTCKWFIPGIPESLIDGQSYAAGALSAAATLISSNGSFTSGGDSFTWGCWSRTHNLFIIPSFVQLSPKVGIIRRRLLPVF